MSFDKRDFGIKMCIRDRLYLIDANSLPALSNNYLYEYISTGRLRLEQLLLLICLVAQKRIGLKMRL